MLQMLLVKLLKNTIIAREEKKGQMDFTFELESSQNFDLFAFHDANSRMERNELELYTQLSGSTKFYECQSEWNGSTLSPSLIKHRSLLLFYL